MKLRFLLSYEHFAEGSETIVLYENGSMYYIETASGITELPKKYEGVLYEFFPDG